MPGDHVFKVLLVDDEPYVTEIIGRILSQMKIEPLTASSGEEALHVLHNHRVDLVITDILMPGMSGLELLEKIKGLYPALPVIVLTAHGDFYVAKEALNRGAFYFLTKPFNKSTILSITEKALRLPRLTSEKRLVLPYAVTTLTYRIPSDFAMVPAISYQVMRACEDMEYSPKKINFAIPLAVDEMVVNAIKHGSRMDVSKEVAVEARVEHDRFTLTVEDHGAGFDFASLPQEFNEESLLAEEGRGIMMTRFYMDELRFENGGRRSICSTRNDPAAA